jgi:hypothetical protein
MTSDNFDLVREGHFVEGALFKPSSYADAKSSLCTESTPKS